MYAYEAFSPPILFVGTVVAVFFVLTMLVAGYVFSDYNRSSIKGNWFIYLLLCWLGLAIIVVGKAFLESQKVNVMSLVVCAVGVIVMAIFAAKIDDIDEMVLPVGISIILLGIAFFVILIDAVGQYGGVRLPGRSQARRLASQGRRLANRVGGQVRRLNRR